MTTIFTYGSLMFPQVWQHVVRGNYRCRPGRITGYSRHSLPGRDYPGLVAAAGGQVEGVLWFDLHQDDVARLDQFEGEQYRRIAVSANVSDGAQTIEAYAYLYLPSDVLPQDWDPARFAVARFLQSHG